jgi:hypothetical protein
VAKLTIRQLLLAAVIGALFAAFQGDPPVPALSKLAVTWHAFKLCPS